MDSIGMVRSPRRQNRFVSECHNLIRQLPSISLSFRNDDVVFAVIILSPEDYFEVDPDTSECECQIELDYPRDDQMSLGKIFLERVGVFIDYENVAIGLCEPL